MFEPSLIEIYLDDEQATRSLAQRFAPLLVAGDTILLEGPIGSGKTHFCRSLIQTRLGRTEDVPSPTFTLVQTYEADVEIWHADLYRLTNLSETHELGLDEAFATAICLVEWPDRLGRHVPHNAIRITLSVEGEGRLALIDASNSLAVRRMLLAEARERLCSDVLRQAGWDNARREALSGDASARRYERLYLKGETRLLMDAPPHQSDQVSDFVSIGRHLCRLGLSTPRIYAEDLQNGLLLIEDFGDGGFARLMQDDPDSEIPLYTEAIKVLAHLQSHPPAQDIPELSGADWAQSAGLVLEWYHFAVMGKRPDGRALTALLNDQLSHLANLPLVMIHRDFHAENLMWLPERNGLQKVGLLDFQLAQMGQPGYDLVSLLQDARRDVGAGVEKQMIEHFLALTGLEESAFLPGYACLGTLRALRVLGIFARLCLVSGKSHYVDLIPRVWAHLQRNLQHPALQNLRQICSDLLPPPNEANLKRIKVQCGNFQS